ncbi:hypothetical protein ACIQRK_05690 [Streptomyces anulatus]
MNHSRKADQDDIVRARNVLLASGRRTPREEVDAYRVLAQVGPAAYLPLLVRALQRLSYDTGSGRKHASALALSEEAVAVARSIDAAEPTRADVLYRALDACQRELYDVGRGAEGLVMRAEMVDIGRAQAELSGVPAVKGLREWAAGLSDEGRYAEAADVMTELIAAVLPDGTCGGALAWSLLDWIAALQDAGRSAETLAVFETLVSMEAADAANDRSSMLCHLYALIGYARMLDTHGRGERASLVRHEALTLLTRLADTGERNIWSSYQTSFWGALLAFSGAERDRPAPTGRVRPRARRPHIGRLMPSGACPAAFTPSMKRWTPLLREPPKIRTGTWPNSSACTTSSPFAPPSTGRGAPISSRSTCAPCSTTEWAWPAGCIGTTRRRGRERWPGS